MHSPLDAHLHTPECNAIIRKLIECHEQHSKLSQLFGACEQLDLDMRKCTRAERIARTKDSTNATVSRINELQSQMRKTNSEGKSWRDILEERQKRV